MIKARSRIFFLTFSICWAFCFGLGSFLILSRPNSSVTERWRDNEAMVHRLVSISLIGTILLGLVASVLLVLELAIRRGWEPAFMEVYRPGCTILESKRLPDGKSSVVVRLPSGEVQTYEADESETKEIQVGSLTHLWVIGQYVSRLQIIKPVAQAAPLALWERNAIKPNSKPFLAGTTILLSTLIGGYLTAYGMVMAFGGSVVFAPMSTDLYEGTEISIIGLIVAIVGISIFAFTAYQWKRGWDESYFENLDDSQNSMDWM